MNEENKTVGTEEAEIMNPPETPEQEAPDEAKLYSFDDVKKKLEGERDKAKDKDFAEPVTEYLLKRCEEDGGLVQDIMQEHKTWKKCMDYINDQAKKKLNNKSGPVKDSVVYEWAEDYYRKDDKAEEAEKAKKEAEQKKKRELQAAKMKEKGPEKKSKEKKPKEKKEEAPKPEPEAKPKKKSDGIDGQMDIFALLG